jgi:hypothetical protein
MIYITTGVLFVVVFYVWVFSPLGTSDRVGITTAISMVALFIVTSIYAWHTRKMADEMKEQRLNESRPYLLIRLEENKILRYPGESNEVIPDHVTITVKNEGQGPAINIRAGFWHPEKTYGGDDIGYLAAGEQWQATIRNQEMITSKDTLFLPELKGIITSYYPEPIVIKYENINKRKWISCLYFHWSAITEGYVSTSEQTIIDLKND